MVPSSAHASPGSRPAPEACFHLVNSAGDAPGNCDQAEEGSYQSCTQRWGEEQRDWKLESGLGARGHSMLFDHPPLGP